MLDKIVFECATAQLFATYGFDMTVKVHEMLRKVPFGWSNTLYLLLF
jgi:hypothetical protein